MDNDVDSSWVCYNKEGKINVTRRFYDWLIFDKLNEAHSVPSRLRANKWNIACGTWQQKTHLVLIDTFTLWFYESFQVLI